MNGRRRLATIALLVSVVAVGCHNWRGPGFSARGPEMPRLRHELKTRPGDVGGRCRRRPGRDGGGARGGDRTERARLRDRHRPRGPGAIRTRVAAAELRNVTILEARARDTGLPTSCCDAVVLRRVYHHLSDPAATNLDLLRALRPGGVLAIIDFPPMFSWLWPWRTGHGVAAGLVVEEVTAGGFTLVKVIEDWPGRGPLKSYCAIFRKPEAGP